MIHRHRELAAGRWDRLPFAEQMANVGSEVERALNWKIKGNDAYFRKASERAFELIDLTLEGSRKPSRLKEVARVREALADYFFGTNEFSSTEKCWRKYFHGFAVVARRHC